MNISIASFDNSPFDISVASARTCYSSRLITPEETASWSKKLSLVKDLFDSGHHTTLQHYNFTFKIEGMSRLLIWRLLHSHPYYNSDQVSQRYTKFKPGIENYYYPQSISDTDSIKSFYERIFEAYEKISLKLTDFYKESSNPMIVKNASKKAIELARYVLPQSAKANLYHTVNLLTVIRYIYAAKFLPEAQEEGIAFSEMLKAKVLELEPSLEMLLNRDENFVFPDVDFKKFPNIEEGSAAVFDIIDRGAKNVNHASNLNLNSIFYSAESLSSFSCKMRLSLSADAQNQRHRSSVGLRPILHSYFYKNKDLKIEDMFFIPEDIKSNPEIYEIYINSLQNSLNFIYSSNVSNQDLAYLLPNAYLFDLVEKNDFYNFAHKAKLRTCLNAQTEIRNITNDVIDKLILTSFHSELVPPCVLRRRQGIHPFCTEGSRFCGVKMWKIIK